MGAFTRTDSVFTALLYTLSVLVAVCVTRVLPRATARTVTCCGLCQFCVVNVSVAGDTLALDASSLIRATVTVALGPRGQPHGVRGRRPLLRPAAPSATVTLLALRFSPGVSMSLMPISKFVSTCEKVTVRLGFVVAVNRRVLSPSTVWSVGSRMTAVAEVSPAGMVNGAGNT